MRINYFEQIKAFYSFVYNTDHEVRTTHHALYNFLLNQNNRSNWVEWFKCPFDLAMQGASINSKNTYYKTLDDLVAFGLIEYKKGINLHKAPQIKIIILSSVSKNGSVNVPLSDTQPLPLTTTQPLQVSEQLNGNILRQETIEFNKPLDNKDDKEKPKRFIPPSINEVKEYCVERKNTVDAEGWMNHYTANGWMVGKNKMKDWHAAVRTWEKNNYGKTNIGNSTASSARITQQQRQEYD